MLKYILLGFLNYQATTGYDLKRLVDNSTAHFWHAYHSQIYTTLRKMEQEGLVTSAIANHDDKLERRIYEITQLGQSQLNSWLERSLKDLPPSKDRLLVRLFFSGSRKPEQVLSELRFQRQLHQQQLEEYQRIEPELWSESASDSGDRLDFEREAQFWRMTLENGLAYEKMYLQWLDETIARVESL